MIDTMGLRIVIDRATYDEMLKQLSVTQRIAQKTGEVEFEHYNHSVKASSDYKIRIGVTDEYWDCDATRKISFRKRGIHQVLLQFSVPKVLYGHNLVSVDISLILSALEKVKKAIEDELKINLPDPAEWYCHRIDTCANFILQNEAQVRSYISYLQKLEYPRRKKSTYEDTGLYYPSRNNTLKVYCKGAEFKKHDMKRLSTRGDVEQLYEQAQNILRVEVEHKRSISAFFKAIEEGGKGPFRKFQGYPQVKDLMAHFDLQGEMEEVVSKIFCGTETTIMKAMNVLGIMNDHYSPKLSRSYHYIYLLIVLQGMTATKAVIPVCTYYRALRAFENTGISLVAAHMGENGAGLCKGFPTDFTLAMNDGNPYYQIPRTVCTPE